MSVCSDLYRPIVIRPRRIRGAECSAFTDQNRWVNFVYSLNLTPDPSDNDPASGLGAWSLWDLPVTFAMQDVSLRGDDLLFVAIADRVYLLDWTAYRDQWNWEAYGLIYRQLTLGPIPGSRDEQEGKPTYNLEGLKRFRTFNYQLAVPPADDPVQSQYKIGVIDDGEAGAASAGYRRTMQNGQAKVAHRGYAFLVTVEHDANEDFPLLDWSAEWEELGERRPGDPVVIV